MVRCRVLGSRLKDGPVQPFRFAKLPHLMTGDGFFQGLGKRSVERQLRPDDRDEGAEDADRYREQHRHGDRPALVERDQEEIGEEQREGEDDPRCLLYTSRRV